MVYLAVWRPDASTRVLCILTGSQSTALADAVRRQVTAIDPAVPVLSTRTIEKQVDNNLLADQLMTALSAFLGAPVLLLAAVGLFLAGPAREQGRPDSGVAARVSRDSLNRNAKGSQPSMYSSGPDARM